MNIVLCLSLVWRERERKNDFSFGCEHLSDRNAIAAPERNFGVQFSLLLSVVGHYPHIATL